MSLQGEIIVSGGVRWIVRRDEHGRISNIEELHQDAAQSALAVQHRLEGDDDAPRSLQIARR
jgi:hypothetical protein